VKTTIQLPEKPITLVQTAQLFADAINPEDQNTARAILNSILFHAHSGAIQGRLPLTREPLSTEGIAISDYAEKLVFTASDVLELAKIYDIEVVVAQESVKTQDGVTPARAPTTSDAHKQTGLSATQLPMKRAALIAAYIRVWPTIERDISDAKKNGLAIAAKAGERGWVEADALNWARAKGKLKNADRPVDSLAQGVNSMLNLPSRKHTF
jgi:hypothetical protein